MSITLRSHQDRVADFIAESARRASRIRPEPDGVSINIRYEYFIAWERINSYAKLAHWIEHLTHKVWWDKYDTAALIAVVQAHFKWKRVEHA